MVQELYTDGGVARRNPSPFGGAWAWVLVEDGEILRQDSGIFHAGKYTEPYRISNNFIELYAAMEALMSQPIGWKGLVWTDSQVTQYRLQGSNSFEGIPSWLREGIKTLRFGRRWTVKLCGGHPNKIELAAGRRERNGLPVSRWNVQVDAECARLCAELLASASRRV